MKTYRQRWSTTEDNVLRTYYAHGGLSRCLDLLPNRNAGGIRKRAWHIGLVDCSPANARRAQPQKSLCADLTIISSLKPKHAKGLEPFSDEWFAACNAAFVSTMRAHHPECEAA